MSNFGEYIPGSNKLLFWFLAIFIFNKASSLNKGSIPFDLNIPIPK